MFDTDEEFFKVMVSIMEDARDRGEPMFLNVPDAWFEPQPKWRCRNDHVSSSYLKSEALRGSVCLACFELVTMTFPDDIDGTPLSKTGDNKNES